MIFTFSERLYADLESALGALKLNEQSLIKQLEQCVLLCIRFLARLRDFYKEHIPDQPADRLLFFKTVKPRFKALLLFHQKLFRIETQRTIGAKDDLSQYYLDVVKELIRYFEQHTDFYKYVRSAADHLDGQYYLPGVFNLHLDPDENFVDADPDFSTSHDNRLAQVIANDLLLVYLEKKILRLNEAEDSDLFTFIEQEKVAWTQTKMALSENLIGWQETKALNNGKLSMARLKAYMERVFHIDLGDMSDNWAYMCGRANKTIYFDEMKAGVLERMDKKNSLRPRR